MDNRHPVRLHRCRFLDWSPSPITALAFPPSLSPSKKPLSTAFPVLAVGRANGNIEIWRWAYSKDGNRSTHQGWVMHQALYSPRPSKVDSLLFTWREASSSIGAPDDLGSLKLFSTTGGTLLIEWDLSQYTIKRMLPSQGGAIWCMAANLAGTILAIGCEDGCVRLVDIEDDEFILQRKFDRVKTRILSIVWGPPIPPRKKQVTEAEMEITDEESGSDEEETKWRDEWLVTGCSDSSLRKWDVKSGRVVERMSTDRTRSEPTLVWAVGVLSDGTIVSGDSMGIVKFWDRLSYTQSQSFQAHGADVLCLTIGPNNAIYTSGVDQKVTEFLSVNVSGADARSLLASSTGQRRWIQSCSRRLHSHDVRSLAIWPTQSYAPTTSTSSNPPILVSAGLDMSPVFTPCAPPGHGVDDSTKPINPFSKSGTAIFEDAHYHRASFLSSTAVCFAPAARLVVCWSDAKVSVWRLGSTKPSSDPGEGIQQTEDGWERVLDMELRVKSNITCCAISRDGLWLAVSDTDDVKLFRLLCEETSGTMQPKRIKSLTSVLAGALPSGLKRGATSMVFSADSKKLIMGSASSGLLLVVGINVESEPDVLRVFEQHRQLDPQVKLRRGGGAMEVDGDTIVPQISRLAVSPDGQWLASGDLTGRVFIFNLDSLQLHSTLPTFPYAPATLTFDAKSSRYLLLALPNNTIKIYDVESKSLPEWQRAVSEVVSKRISAQRDTLLGASFVPSSSQISVPTANGAGSPLNNGKLSLAYQSVVLWGANWICLFRLYPRNTVAAGSSKRGRDEEDSDEEEDATDMDGDVPAVISKDVRMKDKIRGTADGHLFLNVFTQYKNILGVEFLNSEEMVVIERPLLDVLSTMPPAYFKAKYGT